jgi:hypothetical protein
VARQTTGDTPCAICRLPLSVDVGGTRWPSWDLAHDDRGGPLDYLGPAHVRCNRARYAESRRFGGNPWNPRPRRRPAEPAPVLSVGAIRTRWVRPGPLPE